MSGSTLAAIIIPVVVFAALGIWLGAVMYASRHPVSKGQSAPRRWAVSGGTFRGDRRQQMPHRDATPPEAAAWEESHADRDSHG